MVDISSILNKKLRNLIATSAKFNDLPEEKQQAHIERIKDLSVDRQEELCRFLTAENTKEKPMNNEEKLMVLERLYNELVELELKFTKLLRQESETKDRAEENTKIEALLNELNN